MQIPKKVWLKYKDALAAVDQKAAAEMEEYIRSLGEIDSIPWSAVQYAAALTDVYGEAAGAAACEMYDATAAASGAKVKPAEMAELPKIGEVAKVVRGAYKNGSEKVVPGAVGRMVKQVGADTTLKNAQRDGAEFAWVPAGDTCPFCLMLASRGWQKISKKSLKNGHAEHIHANCDCAYCVRFDKNTNVEGYDPKKYREMYDNAEGETTEEKLNSLRREAEAAKKAVVEHKNAQKANTAVQQKLNRKLRILKHIDVTSDYLKAGTPGKGSVTIEPGYIVNKSHKDEIPMAHWLHKNLGGKIVVLKDVNKNNIKTPDFLWNGEYWELKTISSEKAGNSATRTGLHQIFNTAKPRGIIIDYGRNDVDIDYAISVISDRMHSSLRNGQQTDVLVVKNGELFKVLRYKK